MNDAHAATSKLCNQPISSEVHSKKTLGGAERFTAHPGRDQLRRKVSLRVRRQPGWTPPRPDIPSLPGPQPRFPQARLRRAAPFAE
ncbi:MAG TPA: hypothetical protein VLT33_41110, partial [Labilithrix sp.]|nr:hypothetical protein [Labilithrix sp.]